MFSFFFFFNDTATTEIYTLSLHDALPIYAAHRAGSPWRPGGYQLPDRELDRKSTRLNSSHVEISYAVFCLKKKKLQPVIVIPAYYLHPPALSLCVSTTFVAHSSLITFDAF